MSRKKKPEYEPRNVVVSASDLSSIVAHHWDLVDLLNEKGLDNIANNIKEIGDRFEAKLYSSGHWIKY